MKIFKRILAGFLALLLLASGIGISYFFLHKPDVVVTDNSSGTSAKTVAADPSLYEHEEGENFIAFNPNMNVFEDEDASEINDAIEKITSTNKFVYMEIDDGTSFENLGVGDIFFLEGDEGSPFGQPYIGKISSVNEIGENPVYCLETPSIDETFDVLDISCDTLLTPENIESVVTLPGVTMIEDGNVEFGDETEDLSDALVGSPDDSSLENASAVSFTEGFSASTLETNGEFTYSTLEKDDRYDDCKPEKMKEIVSFKDSLIFSFELDLLEIFNETYFKEYDDPDETEGFPDKVDKTQAPAVIVYTTKTGECYHRGTCMSVSRSKFEIPLSEAVSEGYKACFMCTPPLLIDNGKANVSSGITIKGKAGIENLSFSADLDWDLLNGEGIENFSFGINGKGIAEVSLEASADLSLGGTATQYITPGEFLTISGLEEKMFPIAMVNFTSGSFVPQIVSNQTLRNITSTMPLTVCALVYVDISGNIKFGASASFTATADLNYQKTVVANGEFINSPSKTTFEPTISVTAKAEASCDVDTHLGISVLVYIFNVNVLDVSVVKVGAEGEGTVCLNYTTATNEEPGFDLTASYYARIYLKLLGVRLKARAKLELWKFETEYGIDATIPPFDFTIYEIGEKNPTRYDSGSMSYNRVSAKDKDAVYYKSENGALIRRAGTAQTPIYTDEFFTICGIDDSYIYVTASKGGEVYDIYRVAKDGKTSRKILSDIKSCLAFDEEHIYYNEANSPNVIMKLDRTSLEQSDFSSLNETVNAMQKQGDNNWYIVYASRNNFFSSSAKYCLLDKNGIMIADYGSKPEVANRLLVEFENYYASALIVATGYLRNAALEVHWLSRDKSSNILTEYVSGWNYFKPGIVTTLNNDTFMEEEVDPDADPDAEPRLVPVAPYKMVLYRAADGVRQDMVPVHSDQAFFTLTQTAAGDWYFFDQTKDELILYNMASDFSKKIPIKTFSLDELNCNLTDCAMEIMDNTIYFYTITNYENAQVLYHYDIQ